MTDPWYVLLSFFSSLVGFAVLRYGRRASRVPHMLGGFALMAIPWAMPTGLLVALVSVAIGAMVALAIRLGL